MAAATAAAGTIPLTGCGIFNSDPDPSPSPDPLVPLVAEALELAARHDAAATAFPQLADRLAPLAAAHRAHAAELAKATGTSLPSGTPSAPPPGGDADAELAALRGAEQHARDNATAACLAAPARHAALAGSVAAARATHAEVLQ
ncbi:hypothetical protein ACFFWC_02250 [Plantactinospora siamensis]|uniref:DUF4439 domain-containing protein n=1 Tax=Plantactinospora siamensis TaxID=555372 RepID=A0ABV6NU91_9ACTN